MSDMGGLVRCHFENVKPGREVVIVHLLRPLLQCTLDGWGQGLLLFIRFLP